MNYVYQHPASEPVLQDGRLIGFKKPKMKQHRNPVRAAQRAMAKFMGITNKALNKRLRKSGSKAEIKAQIRNAIEEFKNGQR